MTEETGITASPLLAQTQILCDFLEVAIHSILYIRELYPDYIFEQRRKYNVPVPMSRSPDLNNYIVEVIQNMKEWLDKGNLERVAISIVNSKQQPVERFIFEISPIRKAITKDEKQINLKSLAEIEIGLRSFLLKINVCDSLLATLPKECSWSFQCYLRGEEQELSKSLSWIPSDEQEMKFPSLSPLKSFDTGVLKLQLYVEEKSNKQVSKSSPSVYPGVIGTPTEQKYETGKPEEYLFHPHMVAIKGLKSFIMQEKENDADMEELDEEEVFTQTVLDW